MARDSFSMFNLIGCPLLLTCMCFERYLAVIRPVLYLRVRKWEYRMAVSAAVWAITLTFCVATVLVDDITVIMVCVSTIISCTFIIMLTCLGAVVWSLWQQSPAHTTHGIDRCSPLKRRAVANVLVVVVPAVISYLPVLKLFPPVFYIYYLHKSLTRAMCNAFQLSFLFPRFGVLIGPLFYFSKARQMCCLSGTGKTQC
ncbi:P2Y purinoceptor 1-like [Seriola lalandi dorsalis]|uniref:P2Y purinoceptor 1-like n=1 Tax=Seriola lalandi dorsalis TaxID=1841481 RepID=UPI000C6FB845|nr:P2Y purinoceptor 1-like [Seriola lalandi dorsalis]